MKRCALCWKVFWPWSSGINYEGKRYHKLCFEIKFQSTSFTNIIEYLVEQKKLNKDILEILQDMHEYQGKIYRLAKLIDLRTQDQMKYAISMEGRTDDIRNDIADLMKQQINTLEYYPEILEEVRKNQAILDLKVSKKEDIQDLKQHQHTISLFDPILINILLKTTGLTPDDLIGMIRNKEIKRMLNDIKKLNEGGK